MKKEFIKPLFEARKEFNKLLKNKANPFHKSRYADLNALLDTIEIPLENHGFTIDHETYFERNGENIDQIFWARIIQIETGEIAKESNTILPHTEDPQKIGSSITYYRRYLLQLMLNLNADDDDGNKAAGNQTKPKSKNGKTKATNKKELNENQFQKLLMPENYQYIEKYLNTYEMSEAWRKELNEKAGISKEIKK